MPLLQYCQLCVLVKNSNISNHPIEGLIILQLQPTSQQVEFFHFLIFYIFLDFLKKQESHACWLMAQLFRLETENDLSPSKAHREMSTDLWNYDLTTNVLMQHFFIYL